MKRFLNIIIVGLFLLSTTGFTVTKHYCGGNLVDIAINSTPESCCGDNGGGCCSDEQSVYQFISNYVIPTQEQVDESQVLLLELACSEVVLPALNILETKVNCQANAPPLILKEIAYISQHSSLSPPKF